MLDEEGKRATIVDAVWSNGAVLVQVGILNFFVLKIWATLSGTSSNAWLSEILSQICIRFVSPKSEDWIFTPHFLLLGCIVLRTPEFRVFYSIMQQCVFIWNSEPTTLYAPIPSPRFQKTYQPPSPPGYYYSVVFLSYGLRNFLFFISRHARQSFFAKWSF